MSETTVYTEAGLSTGIDSLKKAHAELTKILENLKAELSKSLAEWTDNAQGAYNEVQMQWNKSAQRQAEIIQQMPVILTQISDGYRATESRNAANWSG